jgi:hypothetical protein
LGLISFFFLLVSDFLARNYKLDQAEKMLRQVRNEIIQHLQLISKLGTRGAHLFIGFLVVGVAAIEPGE